MKRRMKGEEEKGRETGEKSGKKEGREGGSAGEESPNRRISTLAERAAWT